MLGVNDAADSKGRVELYEKGYGKDAAGIAREAIVYGAFCLLCPYPTPQLSLVFIPLDITLTALYSSR